MPVTRQPAQARIPVERATTCSIGDHAEVILGPEVVDPGKRGVRPSDHVLSLIVVEVSVLHLVSSADRAHEGRLDTSSIARPVQ